MGAAEERLLDITSYEDEEDEGIQESNPKLKLVISGASLNGSGNSHWKWWFQVALYTFFTLAGLVASTLLGRVYYDQGGKSKWLVAALQTAGFPILVPFLIFSSPKNQDCKISTNKNPPSILVLASMYIALGVLLAFAGITYSIAIENIPASTYTLINSSQLAFNALFAFFLNAQKFTPYIINSIVLLTFAPMLLIFAPDSSETELSPNNNYLLGVLFTIIASAFPALLFSLTQLVFEKLIKSASLKDVIEMTVFQSLVATIVTSVGVVWTGEWAKLRLEMEGYEQGTLSYVMVLVWTAISCQCYTFGAVALTFKASALFSNIVIRLSTPIIPFLSVAFLDEEMNGLKVMSLALGLWGFASYIYQHYLDDLKANNGKSQDSNEELNIDQCVLLN